MRVLQFICPAGLYGAEMWILALAKNLNSRAVECTLCITHESADQNIEIYHRYKALGLNARRIPIKGRFDPKAVLGLAKLIQQTGADIIHTHGYKSDILGLIAARMTGIRAVATPHGFENVKDFKLQTFIKLGCLALRHFDRVVPLSEELMADMARIGVNGKKVRLIENGVDLSEVKAARAAPISEPLKRNGEKLIGYVGQMAYRKNIGDMIRTFDRLYRDHPHVRLVLIGDGPMRGELENLALSMPSGHAVEFLGYRSDRLQLVRQLDLFCMTSSLEGIPRCMMEAMAMGVPVAAFDIPGVNKLVIHEQTGLSAPFEDLSILKACWERLLFDLPFSERIAENGRRHVERHYSGRRMAEEYTALYREMLT